MSCVFGPVPSRRLGQSLGIDPVPFKTCNWNCVYCQLGRSTPLTNERKEYVPTEEILREARRALEGSEPGAIDWVTFVGSGETTLHSELGRMIREVKKLSTLPVAVITNGSFPHALPRSPGSSLRMPKGSCERGKARVIERYGKRFWSAAAARYGNRL